VIGQISIFDILDQYTDAPDTSAEVPPILLDIGQKVYKVIRGDVKELYLCDINSWICGGAEKLERGYRLKEKDGGYDCTWNSKIGVDIFTKHEQAVSVAEEYLKIHDCIRKEDIRAIKTVAYSYIRDIDGRTMTAFYSVLDNGMLYMKEFMTYHHIRKDNNDIKKFMDQQEFQYDKPIEIDYSPNFKNMYPCKNDSDWIYAEASYGYYSF
jgi:hypothetical protein